jgi:hypothetical protein
MLEKFRFTQGAAVLFAADLAHAMVLGGFALLGFVTVGLQRHRKLV